MGLAQEFERISQTEARKAIAKFIYNEVHDWRTTEKRTASKRWLWELLQNARDCSQGRPFSFRVSYKPTELAIQHDAGPFDLREVVALVEGDSSKQRRSLQTTGRFGKGFLVSHVISTEVRVRGILRHNDNRLFRFTFQLSRGGSEGEILQNIRKCAAALDEVSDFEGGVPETKFIYLLSPKDESRFFIEDALRGLKNHCPYLFSFIPELKSINFEIQSENENGIFSATSEEPISSSRLRATGKKILVESPEIKRHVAVFLPLPEHAQPAINESQIAFEILHTPQGAEICTVATRQIARIFQDFPLHATNVLELPVVLNIPRTADVDSNRTQPNLADPDTRKSIASSLALIPALIEWAKEENIGSAHLLAEFGAPAEIQDEEKGNEWRQIARPIVSRLAQLKLVRTGDNAFVRPGEAIFPHGEWLESAERDSELLRGVRDLLELRGERVPIASVFQDWETIIEKWRSLDPDFTLRRIGMRDIFNSFSGFGTLGRLSSSYIGLKSEGAPLRYVGQAFALAADYSEKHRAAPSELQNGKVVLNQDGEFCCAKELRIDSGVHETLKGLSSDLGIPFRKKLVHSALATGTAGRLINQLCAEHRMSNAEAVAEIINEIERRVSAPPRSTDPGITSRVAAQLLVWLARHNDISAGLNLDPFPLLCADGKLRSRVDMRELFLPPPSLLSDSERVWMPLFPASVQLSDDYLGFCDQLGTDRQLFQTFLSNKKLAATSLLVEQSIDIPSDLITSLLPESEARVGHRIDKITATDVPGITRLLSDTAGIVSSSGDPKEAAKVLEFVLRFLVPADTSWKEPQEVECVMNHPSVCPGKFFLYPSLWLAKLKTNRWVPSDDPRTSCEPLNPRNFAKLLQYLPFESFRSSDARAFLSIHCGANPIDLAIRTASGGDPRIEESLRADWATIIETAQPADVLTFLSRRRIASELGARNKFLGQIIETLVKQAFTDHGFIVETTGIGSDFQASIIVDDAEILEEDVGILRLHPSYQGQILEFLVEVKATKTDDVRMSWIQAATATQSSEHYVLCVVDLADIQSVIDAISRTEPVNADSIRDHISLLPNIGSTLAQIVQGLSSAATVSSPGIQIEHAQEIRFRIQRALWTTGLGLVSWVQQIRSRTSEQHAT